MKMYLRLAAALAATLLSEASAQAEGPQREAAGQAAARADSLVAQFRYAEALEVYKGLCPRCLEGAEAVNAAIAAAQCDQDSLALSFVALALEADTAFYDERLSVTELLEACRLLPEWDALQAESERRLENAGTGYDIPLRRQLLEIYHSDQDVRGHLIMAFKQEPKDQQKINRLAAQMARADSTNYAKAMQLLDTYGWIPRSKAGTANQALFFVVQHAAPEVIDRYITVFEEAADKGEIPKDLFAKMYDRNQLFAGKPQRYGTQRVPKEPGSSEAVLWKLEDPENVNSLRKGMGLPPLEGYPQ